MDQANEPREAASEGADLNKEAGSRPQQGGEAATTRFGMEEGDNTDIPATGGPTADTETNEQSR